MPQPTRGPLGCGEACAAVKSAETSTYPPPPPPPQNPINSINPVNPINPMKPINPINPIIPKLLGYVAYPRATWALLWQSFHRV